MPELVDCLPQLGLYPVLPTVMVSTSGTPQTYDGTPAVVSITTGGTAGNEEIDLLLPELPVASGSYNPYLVGLRVIFCITTLTNNADTVVITADGSGVIDFYPNNDPTGAKGMSAGVELSRFSPMVCFVFCGDSWHIDRWLTNDSFGGEFRYGPAALSTVGQVANVYGQSVRLRPEAGGLIILETSGGHIPTADPAIVDAVWNSAGTLKISAG